MNRKYKILALETHYRKNSAGGLESSAVDWWRVVNPYSNLAKHTGWDIEVRKRLVAEASQAERVFSEVGRTYDLVVSSYVDNPQGYAWLRAASARFGVPLILDCDDNLLQVDDLSIVYQDYYPGAPAREAAKVVVSDVDYLTVTTNQLKALYTPFRPDRPQPIVFPNLIDLSVYDHQRAFFVPEKTREETVKIGWWGSMTHYKDLMVIKPVLEKLIRKYQNLHVDFIGMPIDEFSVIPRIKQRLGQSDFSQWIRLWQSFDFDIVVCPLADIPFNKGKSNIKWQEATAAKMPVVASNLPCYAKTIAHGKTGFIAADRKDWEKILSELIEKPKLRQRVANAAYEELKAHYTIERAMPGYAALIERAITNGRPWMD